MHAHTHTDSSGQHRLSQLNSRFLIRNEILYNIQLEFLKNRHTIYSFSDGEEKVRKLLSTHTYILPLRGDLSHSGCLKFLFKQR